MNRNLVFIIQKIAAPNDTAGNPRRGWLVRALSPSILTRNITMKLPSLDCTEYLGFVREGYNGEWALVNALMADECAAAGIESAKRNNDLLYTLRESLIDCGSISTTPTFYNACVRDGFNRELLATLKAAANE